MTRKFNNAIKVKCLACGIVYWKEYGNGQACCSCGSDELMEYMNDTFDYDRKRELEEEE